MNGWIVAVGLVVFGALRILLTSQVRARAREDQPPPRPKVRETLASAADGEFVELTGWIQATEEALTAVLSGTPCVAYVAIARVWHSKQIPQLVAEECEMKLVPLVVAMTDGEVTIDDSCRVECPTAALSPRAPEREAAFLASRKLERYLKSTEFEEGVVRSGDQIWVRGVVVRDRSGEHGYRDSPERTRLVAGPKRPLAIGRPRRGARTARTPS